MKSSSKSHESPNFAECACFNLRKASRAITQYYDRTLHPVGLRVTQFTILVSTVGQQDMTISKMAKLLVMDRTTLTRNLRPLEKRGLIQIKPGQDQRTRYLSLPKKGKDILAKALPLWQTAQTHFKKGLGPADFRNLRTALAETIELTKTQ